MMRADSRRYVVVDLSVRLGPQFPVHPANSPVRVTVTDHINSDGCFAQRWEMHEHSGTHIDAPAHFMPEAATADDLPVSHLVLPLAVIDVRGAVAARDDRSVRVEDVLAWEARFGTLPDPCALLAFTGWSEDTIANTGALHAGADISGWPGFHPAVPDFLLSSRPQVVALGIDSPSLDTDRAESDGSPVHRRWLGDSRYGLEHLRGLGEVPQSGATVIVGAIQLTGASGAPARVLALVPRRHAGSVLDYFVAPGCDNAEEKP